MRKYILFILVNYIVSCNPNIGSKNAEVNIKAPSVAYQVINERNDNGTHFYDIYLKDAADIKMLNAYLKEKYNKNRGAWIEINYFIDSSVARNYFEKQFDNNVSDKVKDKLFESFIANYKYNPNTKYDTPVYEH